MYYRLIFVIFVIHSLSLFANADTIYLKNGDEEKGIVVENYHDRVVLSTFAGEKSINKRHIKDIEFDRREQNLVKLGDFYEHKGDLAKAYEYYNKAYRLNPDYKEAENKFMHIRSVLLRSPEERIREAMAKRQAVHKESGRLYTPQPARGISTVIEERLKSSTGLMLVSDDGMPKVKLVVPDSPAEKAGIHSGDILYSLWGRLTGYINLRRFATMIIDSPTPEMTFTIKRKVHIRPTSDSRYGGVGGIGLFVGMKEEGLTVTNIKEGSIAADQGLRKGDLLTAINREKTRYMPLKDAVALMNNHCSQGDLELELLRETTLWRKDD